MTELLYFLFDLIRIWNNTCSVCFDIKQRAVRWGVSNSIPLRCPLVRSSVSGFPLPLLDVSSFSFCRLTHSSWCIHCIFSVILCNKVGEPISDQFSIRINQDFCLKQSMHICFAICFLFRKQCGFVVKFLKSFDAIRALFELQATQCFNSCKNHERWAAVVCLERGIKDRCFIA